MNHQIETTTRWEPIPGLPECPLGSATFSYDGQSLSISASYAYDPANRSLLLDFSPQAFKAYEEFSDPWMEHRSPQPRVNNPALNRWTYPLQEMHHSRWLQRVIARNTGIEGYAWRHFIIVTADMCLHVMATGPDRIQLI